jgi:diguanylate cyclase (GGDEF)-like protein
MLKVSIFYENNEKEQTRIENLLEVISVLFDLISQTVYSKFLEFKIDELSLKDCLTGLYNRQYIDEYLKSTLPLSNRERKKMAFIKIGIDHFKAVIDEFDYTIGDKVLQELARSVQNSVRRSDLVARIEADEFFVVLHNILNEENAIMIANKIVDNFKNVRVIVNEEKNQTLMKTICTGVSIYPDDAQKIEDIFRSSDIALYEARNKGRSQTFKFKKEDINTIDLF